MFGWLYFRKKNVYLYVHMCVIQLDIEPVHVIIGSHTWPRACILLYLLVTFLYSLYGRDLIRCGLSVMVPAAAHSLPLSFSG